VTSSIAHDQSAAERPPVASQQSDSIHSRRSLLDRPRTAAILLGIIVLIGMGIRAYRLTDRSMWFDESSSWRTSRLPLPEMLDSLAKDTHVPLYYILLKSWTTLFGESLWAMRGLSVLLGGLTIISAYLFAAEAFVNGGAPLASRPACAGARGLCHAKARWIGLFSAALVAVSLLQIRVAWEVRMYTLGTALVALSSWTLFRGLRSPAPSWKRWTVHALTTLLLAYTHHYGLFSIAGQIVFLTGYFLLRYRQNIGQLFGDRQFRAAVVSYAIVGMGWALWLPVLLAQTRQVEQGWWAGPLGSWDALSRCYEMFLGGSASHLSAGIATCVCAIGLAALVWKKGAAEWYVFCLAVVPCAFGATASFAMGKNVYLIRYLVFAQLFLLVGLAALVGRIRDPWLRNLIAAFIIANGVGVYIDSWSRLDIASKPGVRAAVAFIEANGRADEQVIICSPMYYFPASYYFADRTRCHVFSDGAPLAYFAGGPFVTNDDLMFDEEINKLGPGRVWLIRGGWSPAALTIPPRWQLSRRESFQGVPGFEGVVEVEAYDVTGPRSPPRQR
jgi:mannosyltransferase